MRKYVNVRGQLIPMDKLQEFLEPIRRKHPRYRDILIAREKLAIYRKQKERGDPMPNWKIAIGQWVRCQQCKEHIYIKILEESFFVCKCGFQLEMGLKHRFNQIVDPGTWRRLDKRMSSCNPIKFVDRMPYSQRLKEIQDYTKCNDAIETGTARIGGIPVALGIMNFSFIGGSMGSVVGEKVTRLIEYATTKGLSLIIMCASGGARMQEGALSLMQMSKISGALHVFQNCAHLLYISVLTSPTTGGVTASFASSADIMIGEPEALIGFAGRRVIETVMMEEIPEEFQTAEIAFKQGFLDMIVQRKFLKGMLCKLVRRHKSPAYKRVGKVWYGSQKNFYFDTEEKLRRSWKKVCHVSNRVVRNLASDMILDILESSDLFFSFCSTDIIADSIVNASKQHHVRHVRADDVGRFIKDVGVRTRKQHQIKQKIRVPAFSEQQGVRLNEKSDLKTHPIITKGISYFSLEDLPEPYKHLKYLNIFNLYIDQVVEMLVKNQYMLVGQVSDVVEADLDELKPENERERVACSINQTDFNISQIGWYDSLKKKNQFFLFKCMYP